MPTRRRKQTAADPKNTPFLWFDHQAEDGQLFNASIFSDSLVKVIRYGEPSGPAGSA